MSEPVSILFTIPNFITAGSGRAMLNIVERLNQEKFAPAVCVLKKGGNLDREVEKMGIPFIEAPFTVPAIPRAKFLPRAWKAAQVFRSYRFALWHSFHYADDYTEAIIARLAGAKAWVYTKKNMNWDRRAWYLRSLFATRIAAQNTDMLGEFFGNRLFQKKTRFIKRGVDTTLFRPDIPPRLELRSQLRISPETTVIACVAHLLPVKGHLTLMQALAHVPDTHLLVAGKPLDKEYTVSLERLACELGIAERIHFLGGVSDVPALLAEADIFVLSTWARWRMEGCPVALLEAMACAKACIATDIPGARDLIEHDHCGWLVPPEDPQALAHALRRLAAYPELRPRFGLAARRRVEQHFTIEQEVTKHESMYAEILRLD